MAPSEPTTPAKSPAEDDTHEEGVKRMRTTPRRGANKTKAVQKPGNAQDQHSFIETVHEAETSAYCGFNDIGKFRHFYLSSHVLPHYLRSLSYKGAQRKKVLVILRDHPYDKFWKTEDDPRDVYSVDTAGMTDAEKKSKALYGFGLIAWQMLRGLRKAKVVLRDVELSETDKEQFTRKTECILPSPLQPFPSADLPDFGHFATLGESELEALNRCLCLLIHMKHATAKSQWARRMLSATSPWSSPLLVSAEYVPDWMRTLDISMADTGEMPDEIGDLSIPEPRDMVVAWKFKSRNPLNVAFKQEMGEDGRGVLDQIPRQATVTLEYNMLGSQARDRIREAFKLQAYEGQLAELTLLVKEEADDTDDDATPTIALKGDWNKVRDMMWLHKNGDTRVKFTCLFRLREPTEVY
jgi:hypothetical protein